jgi:hypothetical protein
MTKVQFVLLFLASLHLDITQLLIYQSQDKAKELNSQYLKLTIACARYWLRLSNDLTGSIPLHPPWTPS